MHNEYDSLCKHKNDGGMSFHNLHLFNQALFSKQAGRLYNFPNSFIARDFQSFFHSNKDFGKVYFKKRCSYVWKKFLRGNELYDLDAIWRVGYGNSIFVYEVTGNLKLIASTTSILGIVVFVSSLAGPALEGNWPKAKIFFWAYIKEID